MTTIKPSTIALLTSALLSSSALLAQEHANHNMPSMTKEAKLEQVTAMGVIKAVLTQERKLKVYHQPIEAWNMGAMQMSFQLDPRVEISTLSEGQTIHFKLTNPSTGKYIITKIMTH